MKNTITAQHPDGRVIKFSQTNWNLLGPNKGGFVQISTDVPEEVSKAIEDRKAESHAKPPVKRRKKGQDATD
jgi:hypothetical protein